MFGNGGFQGTTPWQILAQMLTGWIAHQAN
jgi:hypothetical protein